MKEYFKKYGVYVIIGLVIIFSVIFYNEPKDEATDDATTDTSLYEESEQTYIYVDLKGEVLNPGVYKVEKNTRLFQVVNLAGGLTSDANSLLVNLSIVLVDQMTIYIPSIFDVVDIEIPLIDNPNSDLLDINQANLEQLMTLPGIGPATAQNIIDYRDTEGYFEVIEDIMNVPNIGESTFDSIKDLITT